MRCANQSMVRLQTAAQRTAADRCQNIHHKQALGISAAAKLLRKCCSAVLTFRSSRSARHKSLRSCLVMPLWPAIYGSPITLLPRVNGRHSLPALVAATCSRQRMLSAKVWRHVVRQLGTRWES